jgi:hypothetical protein
MKEDIIMRRMMIILLLTVGILMPGLAGAVSEKDFEVQTTENIINLCTASLDDPLYHQAINFCHGFLVGAYRYYEAAGSGPAGLKLVCLTDPPPSRNDSFAMFVEWVKAHPQYRKENAVETEFRFLMEKWPCKP